MLKVFFRIFDFILFFGFFIQSKTRGTRISENPVLVWNCPGPSHSEALLQVNRENVEW